MANWVRDYTEKHPELVSKGICGRAKNAIYFGRGNGLITGIFTGMPCHYLDNGNWRAIDTSLQEASGGWYGAPHSKVMINKDGHVKLIDATHKQYSKLPGNPIGHLDGDRIVREFDNGVQYLIMKENGFKHKIYLENLPPMEQIKYIIPTVSGTLPYGYKFITKIIDANKKLYDYKGYEIKDLYDWLQKAVYPLIIDPDFSSAADANKSGYDLSSYSTARSTFYDDTSPGDYEYLSIGQWKSSFTVRRAYLSFDTSSLNASDVINQVNLNMYWSYDMSDTDFDIQIVKQDWSSGTDEEIWDGCLNGDADDSIWQNSSAFNDNNKGTSGNLNTSRINKDGSTYYSFRSSRDKNNNEPTGNEYINVHSQESETSGYRPTLTIVYASRSSKVFIIT